MKKQNAETSPKYQSYTLQNFRKIPQIQQLSPEKLFEIEVVGNILPFKANNYVVEELIQWDKVPNDPFFILTFPQKEMLQPQHFEEMARTLKSASSPEKIKEVADKIRWQLNPHPAGQMEHNVPVFQGQKLNGMQHKYKETVLFFPSQGQTCHAYCTFCFRWPQFVGLDGMKFAMKESELLVGYLKEHPEVSDVLFTGGDPMIMNLRNLTLYIEPLLHPDLSHIQRIRIGTKALGYWPYRFLSDPDSAEVLALFRKVTDARKHLAIMAHFNHPQELKTESVQQAIREIRATGAEIRTQSPLLRNINNSSSIWAEMWKTQVNLGCIPYYMFLARDTGAQEYFSIPLVDAWKIYREAYQKVSGLSRTVRGPSMSANPGKIQILGVSEIRGEKVIVLRFLQGRDPQWVLRPFFAEYNEKAVWLDELKPAWGEKKFFFEEELEHQYHEDLRPQSAFNLE